MSDEQFTTPNIAAARILAIYKSTKALHQRTGGDPAEAAFELIAAAVLCIQEARPSKASAAIIADIAPHAEECAVEWFKDLIAQFRKGDA